MDSDTKILTEQAAQMLWDAEQTGISCQPVRELIGMQNLGLAYRIQNLITQKKIEQGGKIVGKKIGLTSIAVQKQLGVDQPDYGMLFDDRAVTNGGELIIEEVMQPRVEAEFALVLGEDLLSPVQTAEEVLNAIDHVRVSLEIIGSRIQDWNIKITDTIADNASASHFVLGEDRFKPKDVDFIGTKAWVYKNEILASEGIGEACMGSPVLAAKWLANTMIELRNPLKKGEIILTGALGPIVPLVKGDQVKAIFEGLGEVAFRLV